MQKKLYKTFITVVVLQVFQMLSIVQADVEHDTPLDHISSLILNIVNHQQQGIKLIASEEVCREPLIMYEIEAEYDVRRLDIQISSEGNVLKMKNEYCKNSDD